MPLAIGIGIGTSLEGVGGIPWRSRGLIASRMADPVQSSAPANGGTFTALYDQQRFPIGVSASDISLVYHNIRQDADGYANIQVKAAAFASSSVATYQGVTSGFSYEIDQWAGGSDSNWRSPNIVPGAYLETNRFALDVTAGSPSLLMVRSHANWASAPTTWPHTSLSKFLGDEPIERNAVYTERISPTGGANALDWAGGYYIYDLSASMKFGPSAILGTMVGRTARVKMLGDSILAGSGDADIGTVNFVGPIQRLITHTYPWSMWQTDGDTLNNIVNTAGNLARFLALIDLMGITHVIVQSCTNDFENSRTSANLLADLATLKAALLALPLKPRLIPCTPPPITDAGNTTPNGSLAQRRAYDAALRAANGVGYGYIDFAVLWAGGVPASGTGLWDVTGGKGTADGVHGNKPGYVEIASANTSALSTLLSVSHYV